jgi:hypothetical protein
MSESLPPSGQHRGGHEKADANVRSLAIFGVCMFVTLAITCVGMWGVFRYFAGHQTLGPPASPFTQARPLPAAGKPRLQAAPRMDLEQALAEQNQLLNSYGWVDQKTGVVRIPIDRAMELLLERGLPVRGGQPPTASGPVRKVKADGP